jgi:hypothetical protein
LVEEEQDRTGGRAQSRDTLQASACFTPGANDEKEPFVTVSRGQEHRNYGIVKPRKSQWNFLEFVVDISAS